MTGKEEILQTLLEITDNPENEFDKFIKKLKSRSVYDYGIEVSGEDKVLTLSSCIGDGTKRVVLHAKLIEIEEDL